MPIISVMMMERKTTNNIPIVVSPDDEYVVPTYVMLHSLIKHKASQDNYDIIVLTKALTEENCKLLKSLATSKFGVSVRILSVGESFGNTKLYLSHTSIASMYRLLLPQLLLEYDKCLYIDGDALICDDIAKAYEWSLDNNYLAAVRDIEAEEYIVQFEYEITPPMDSYVNSGFLVMNLKKMREDNLVERFCELSDKKFLFCDQDIINIVCHNKIQILPLKYNAMIKYRFLHYRLRKYSEKVMSAFTVDEIYEAHDNPIMIHYAQPIKPWQCKYVYEGKIWNDYVKKNIEENIRDKYIVPYIKKSQKKGKIQFELGIRYFVGKTFIYKYLLKAAKKI